MCLVASLRHFRSLVIVPFLVVILAFPASAQTSTESNGTGTAGAPGHVHKVHNRTAYMYVPPHRSHTQCDARLGGKCDPRVRTEGHF